MRLMDFGVWSFPEGLGLACRVLGISYECLGHRVGKCTSFGIALLLILKVFPDLTTLSYHNSQGTRYFGSCRVFSIHCITY